MSFKLIKHILLLYLLVPGYLLSAQSINLFEIENKIAQRVKSSLSMYQEGRDYILNVEISLSNLQENQTRTELPSFNDEEVATDKSFVLFRRFGLEAPLNIRQPQSQVFNLADSISGVNITILHDENWSEDELLKVKNILSQIKLNISAKHNIEFTPITLTSAQELDLASLLQQYSLELGLLFAVILLCFFAAGIFFLYSAQTKKNSEALIQSNNAIASAFAAQEQGGDEPSVLDNAADSGKSTENSSNQITDSIERFKNFVSDKENSSKASGFIKKWLSLESSESRQALCLVAEGLPPDLLLRILSGLNLLERKKWKECIEQKYKMPNLNLGAKLIDSELIEEIIIPTDLLSDETKSLICGLAPAKCAQFISENKEFGPLLMNSLSSSFLAKVLGNLPTETVQELTLGSVSIDTEELKSLDSQVVEKIQSYLVDTTESPFAGKIMELLPQVNSEQQEFFFTALAKGGDREKLKKALQQFLPAKELIRLPDDIMKTILSRFRQNQLIEFLLVCEEEISSKYLEITAPSGTNKRDMLDLELENGREDEIALAKLKKDADRIQSNFVDLARKTIKSSEKMLHEIDPIIEELCDNYMGTNTSTQQAAA